VIAARASRLRRSDGTLTIRSPSAMVLRMLDITGVAEVVRLEHPDPVRRHLDAEQSSEIAEALLGPRRTACLPTSGRLRHPADSDVVDGALRLVVALARATVGVPTGERVPPRHGRLATVAASDQTISDMDTSQYATGEGPCVDASVNGRWFHAESWTPRPGGPTFTPRAQALGSTPFCPRPYWPRTDRSAPSHLLPHLDGLRAEGSGLASVFAAEASLVLTVLRGCDRRAALRPS